MEPVLGRPYVIPPADQVPIGQTYGKTVILTGKFIYILSPADSPEDCRILSYISSEPFTRYVPHRAAMGSRHAIWTSQRSVVQFIGLQTCAYFTAPKACDAAFQRLAHIRHSGIQFRSLRLPVRSGDVLDLSWDEDSGQLCALIGRGGAGIRILVVGLA